MWMPSAAAPSSLVEIARSARPKRELRSRPEIHRPNSRITIRQTSFMRSSSTVKRTDAERRYAGIAHVALRQAGPLHRQIVGDEAEREGGHGKVVAAQPQRRITDDERSDAGDRHRDDQRQHRLPAIFDAEDRGAVTADRRKGVLAERGLPGIAHEEIQPDAEHAIDHRELHHGQQIAALDEDEGEQQRDEDRACRR